MKFPIVEPAPAARPGQIEQFLTQHDGPGVQHVALATSDILTAVDRMRVAGVNFLPTPPSHYTDPHVIQQAELHDISIDELRSRSVLIDSDPHGSLLQILTIPVHDRATGFFELIERHGSRGFGAGNFTALFRAIETEQHRRDRTRPET